MFYSRTAPESGAVFIVRSMIVLCLLAPARAATAGYPSRPPIEQSLGPGSGPGDGVGAKPRRRPKLDLGPSVFGFFPFS